MKTLKKYFRIWYILTSRTTAIAFASRAGAIIFIIGKILRFGFFFFFLILIVSKTKTLAGYSLWQVVFFYATFNLIDTLPQFFFREVYRFRWLIVSGEFDIIVLTKPISALFRTLFGGTDVFDLSILFLSLLFTIVALNHMTGIQFINVILYIALIINAVCIAFAFHIAVAALAILTTEIENSIMIYRDVTQMGRFPVDIYKEPVRGLITFVVPVGIMMTFPGKALLGLLSPQFVLLSFWISGFLLFLAFRFWKYALTQYSSASS